MAYKGKSTPRLQFWWPMHDDGDAADAQQLVYLVTV